MSIQRRARRAMAAVDRRRGASDAVRTAFDADWYRTRYPETAALDDPLRHYVEQGWREGRDPCALFDTAWYLETNQDVRGLDRDPLSHYVEHGWAEGRDPSPIFSTRWYLNYFPGRAAWTPDPMTHYRLDGWQAGRDPHPLFDVDWYLTQLAQSGEAQLATDPLTHYTERGWRIGLDPNPVFDTQWYTANLAGNLEGASNPLSHYVARGAALGRDPSPLFSTAAYASRNPQCGGRAGALAHYLEFGRAEGSALPLSSATHPAPADERPLQVLGNLDLLRSADQLAVVAAHDQRGRIGAAARHLTTSLTELGYAVVLAYDHPIDESSWSPSDSAAVVASTHDGYDFFSWRTAIEAIGSGHRYREILVMNDSVIGPIADPSPMFAAWRTLPFDVTGLVESVDPRPHLQSWGLLFTGAAASTDVLLAFYGKASDRCRKGDLIDFLEVPLAEHFRSQGFAVGSLFSHVNTSIVDRNPAIAGWHDLLASGLVFVKREAIALPSAVTWSRTSDIVDSLIQRSNGYADVASLISDSLAQIGRAYTLRDP